MREQINNNPVVQIGIVAVLLVVAGFMLLSSMGGGKEEEGAESEATVTMETPEGTASMTVTAPVEGEAPPTAATLASAPPVPRLRLPQPVREAIDANRTVVLLVVKSSGIDDSRVEEAVTDLSSRPGVETFVVPADQAPRYTAITQAVQLERTPALIVVRPRKLSQGLPTASINYGFQSIATILQAVADARYRGPELGYHP